MARVLLFVKDMFSLFQSKLMMILLSRSVLQDRKSPLLDTQISLSDGNPPRVTTPQTRQGHTQLPQSHPPSPHPRSCRVLMSKGPSSMP